MLGVFVPFSREESGLNPERKLLPGSKMAVEVQAAGRHLSKAGSRVHARRAFFVNFRRGGEQKQLVGSAEGGRECT